MAKFLLVLIVAVVAAWALFGRQRRVRDDGPRARKAAPAGAEDMVPCAHCGVHLPRGDAVMDGELAYCSVAHRQAGPQRR
jgi:uncharacterized protein